jgi:hypothetical protein
VLVQVPAGEEGSVIAEVVLPDSPCLPKGGRLLMAFSFFLHLFDCYANLLLAGK